MRIARRLLWCLVALAGCTTGPHDSDRQVIGQDECVTCHQSDYDLTARADLTPLCSPMRPDHPALRLDVACGNCHQEFSWCPALEAGEHPEDCFRLRGAHDVSCQNCHDPSIGPSASGLNTTCTSSSCHSYRGSAGEHDEERNYDAAYELATANGRQNFCVSCHWSGRDDPENDRLQLDGNPSCPQAAGAP
ncbi:MAG: hypothetical protein IPI43_04420 [Sandaracinaceae bacterium]|nr:hypothetical protein [Sandaracinaceae bacterium]